MKDYTVSKKIDGKYVTMISVKEGWKFSFMPAFKKEMKDWLASDEGYWNGNIKEWEVKATETSSHAQAKQDGYQPAQADLGDDAVPF